MEAMIVGKSWVALHSHTNSRDCQPFHNITSTGFIYLTQMRTKEAVTAENIFDLLRTSFLIKPKMALGPLPNNLLPAIVAQKSGWVYGPHQNCHVGLSSYHPILLLYQSNLSTYRDLVFYWSVTTSRPERNHSAHEQGAPEARPSHPF